MMTDVDEAVIGLAALVLEIDCRSEDRGEGVCSLAIRRLGQRLSAAGGIEAMRRALADVLSLSPVNARERQAIIEIAWAGLPGWQAVSGSSG